MLPKEKGLRFDKSEGKLISYSDADWAGDTVSVDFLRLMGQILLHGFQRNNNV